jgi:hypothetical protein
MAFRFLLLSDHANGSTDFEDSSPDARSITVVGDPKHSTAVGSPFPEISSSIYFDGVGDRLEVVMPNINTLSALTVDCFFRRNSIASTIGMYGDNEDESVFIATSAVIAKFGSSTTLAGPNNLIYAWYHYALTWDGINAYLFRDGILSATGARSAYDSTNFWIGAYKKNTDTIIDNAVYVTNFAIRNECVWSGSGYSVGDQVFTPPTAPYGATPSGGKSLINGFNSPLINRGLLIRGVY